MKTLKKLPSIQLDQLALPALTLTGLGFLMMQVTSVQELGAMLFAMGLFPLALIALKHIKP